MSIQFINKGGNSGEYIVPDGVKFAYTTIFPTGIDTKNVTDMTSMFENGKFSTISQIDTSNTTTMKNAFVSCSNLVTIPQLDTSKVTNMQSMFGSCVKLVSIPQLDTSKATTMQSMFYGCSQLTTIPQLNASGLVETLATQSYNKEIFYNCSSLSDESLNNILAMCITMGAYSTHRTLKKIGLTSEQAARCQELSNWDNFVAAGWSTGY